MYHVDPTPLQKSSSIQSTSSLINPNNNPSPNQYNFISNGNGYGTSIVSQTSSSSYQSGSIGGVLGTKYLDESKRLYSFEIDYAELKFDTMIGISPMFGVL